MEQHIQKGVFFRASRWGLGYSVRQTAPHSVWAYDAVHCPRTVVSAHLLAGRVCQSNKCHGFRVCKRAFRLGSSAIGCHFLRN